MAVYESMKESGIEWIGKIPATWWSVTGIFQWLQYH